MANIYILFKIVMKTGDETGEVTGYLRI